MMLSKLRKLAVNYSPRGVAVLGPWTYARFLATSLARLPAVLRAGDLRAVDRAAGRYARRFRVGGRGFVFDCRHADDTYREGAYAFGLVRELYVRDCYFRHHPPGTLAGVRTALDLGANRGAFAAMLAPSAERVVCVEANPAFVPVIRHNLRANGVADPLVECAFVGAGGDMAPGPDRTTVEAVLDKYGIGRLDFLKMDIEGSEFDLFRNPGWLARVRAVSMEVHRRHGDPAAVVAAFAAAGFRVTLADENLRVVADPAAADFVYARRSPL